MKNSFLSVLILLFVLPAFAPWLPHGAVHELHDNQAAHHSFERPSHAHKDHDDSDHDMENKQAAHHPIHVDVTTYFSDYLHVDLQSPEQIIFKAPALDTHDTEYALTAIIDPAARYELATIQSRAPPDGRRLWPNDTPIYLSTLRLRL